jgi:hypothetical protein
MPSVPNRRELLAIAVVAEVDPRTVAKCFDQSQSISPLAAAAVRRALEKFRLSDPRPKSAAPEIVAIANLPRLS